VIEGCGLYVNDLGVFLVAIRVGFNTILDDVLPVVVGGRQLNVVNVEAVVVTGRCPLKLESIGSGLDGNVEGCSFDRVVRGIESTDYNTVPNDISL
jgi:hypothetical protein